MKKSIVYALISVITIFNCSIQFSMDLQQDHSRDSGSNSIKRRLSRESIALSEIVQTFQTDHLQQQDAPLIMSCCVMQKYASLVTILLTIISSEAFKTENTITCDLATEILKHPLAVESLIDLANEDQIKNLLQNKTLIRLLLELEQGSQEAQNQCAATREMLINLGLFNPEIDTIANLFPITHPLRLKKSFIQ